MPDEPLIQGRDYYIEPDGRWVFTAEFLLRRGYCCGNGCRHCPYDGAAIREQDKKRPDQAANPPPRREPSGER